MRSRRSAFTLIELMLVAVLLGVIAAIAAPRIGAILPRVSLQAAARQVADDVRAAQAYAVDRGRVVYLEYDLDEGAVRLCAADAASRPPALDPLPQDVSIAGVGSSTSGTVQVAVFPSGYVTPHQVELTSGEAGRMTVGFSGLGTELR